MKVKATDYKGWCNNCKCWRLFRWQGELTTMQCGCCKNTLHELQHDNGQKRLNFYAD